MVTVHRAHAFRFVIFANDHSPAHVHVFGQGGEAKVTLEALGGIRLDWFVQRERLHLIAMWRRIHGR
jgi:Domain of unknown function (DUF4160)